MDIEKMVQNMAREEARKVVSEMMHPEVAPEEKEEDYVAAKVVCKKFGISLMTLTRHRNSGKVPAYRFGGRVLYLLSEVEATLINTRRS